MRLATIAVGRLKTGPERDLVERYRARAEPLARRLGLRGPDMVEIPEGRSRSADERRNEEGAALLVRAADSMLLVCDERGETATSAEFATALRDWRDAGRATLALAIGGPDGLSEGVRARADRVLSFGRATLPHGLVRVLLAEQIYRALTILSGHPYHREG